MKTGIGWDGSRLLAIMLAAAALIAGAGVAEAQSTSEKRLALIIANEAYTSRGLGSLPGVKTDVDVMQPALRQAGFEVTVARNIADKASFERVVSDFSAKLTNAGNNTVAFVYYTGHGVADSKRGRNFLIPTTAELQTLADLPLKALPLDDLLDAIQATDVKIAMVVADACRNTPISLTKGDKGMVSVRNRTDMLVAFATQPGETAEDNNVYARTLAQELVKPGANTKTAFAEAQSAVALATGLRQRPEFVSGLVQHVTFVPGAVSASTSTAALSARLVPVLQKALTPTGYKFLERETARAVPYFQSNRTWTRTRTESGYLRNGDLPRDDCELDHLSKALRDVEIGQNSSVVLRASPLLVDRQSDPGTQRYCDRPAPAISAAPAAPFDPGAIIVTGTRIWDGTVLDLLGPDLKLRHAGDDQNIPGPYELTGRVELDPREASPRSLHLKVGDEDGGITETNCRETRRWRPGEWNEAFPFHVLAMQCSTVWRWDSSVETEEKLVHFAPELMMDMDFIAPTSSTLHPEGGGVERSALTPSEVEVERDGENITVEYLLTAEDTYSKEPDEDSRSISEIALTITLQ